MKAKSTMMIVCLMLISSYSFANCGGLGGDCGSDNFCNVNEYDNTCQCTDPVCHSVDKGCLSTGECCEAFGNIGAR